MNPLFARFLRRTVPRHGRTGLAFASSVYRKEPVSGFILILGVTDALIGGLNGRVSLLSIGLLIALLGIVMRWRQGEKKSRAIATKPVRYMLPPSSSRKPLPLLTSSKQRK